MSCGIPWPHGPSASTCASSRQDLQRKMEWRAPTGSHILIPAPGSTIRQSALQMRGNWIKKAVHEVLSEQCKIFTKNLVPVSVLSKLFFKILCSQLSKLANGNH